MKKKRFFKFLTVALASVSVFSAPIMLAGCDNAKIEELNGKITELEQNNSTLGSQIVEKDNEIANLTTTNTSLNETIATLRSEAEADEAEITRLEGVVEEKEDEIETLNGQVSTLTTQKSNLETQVQDLQTQINSKNTQIENLTTTNNSLNETITTLRSEAEADEAEIARLEGVVEEKEDEIETLKGQVSTLTTQKSNLETQVQDLQTQINSKNTQIGNLEEERDSLIAEVEELEEETNRLNALIDSMENVEIDASGVVSIDKLPSLEDKNGFAGEWEASVKDGLVILTPTWGDGTEKSPYKVSTVEQFLTMVKDCSKEGETTYYDASGTLVGTEAEAKVVGGKKVVNYPTLKRVSTYSGTAWGSLIAETTNTLYFELINDIDCSTLDLSANNGGDHISLSLDGNGFAVKNLNGNCFLSNSSSIFNTLIDSSIKNIEFNSDEELTTVAYIARGGLLMEDVKTTANQEVKFLAPEDADRNRGVFVKFILASSYNGETKATFRRCVNEVDFYSVASYNGVFVGGYLKSPAKVEFDSCVNYGNLSSAGMIGVLIGNGSATNIITYTNLEYNFLDLKNAIVVRNCVNAGVIKAAEGSHFFSTNNMATQENKEASEEFLALLDNDLAGVVSHTQESAIIENQEQFSIANDGRNIVISENEGFSFDFDKNNYELIMSRSYSNRQEVKGNQNSIKMQLLFNLSDEDFASYTYADGSQTDIESVVLNDIFYDFYSLSELKRVLGVDEIDLGSDNFGKYLLNGIENEDVASGIYKYIPDEVIETTYRHSKGEGLGYEYITFKYGGMYVLDDTNGGLYSPGRFAPVPHIPYLDENGDYNTKYDVGINFELKVTDKETGEIVYMSLNKVLYTSEVGPTQPE